MEKNSKELCEAMEIGRPKGKTMMSGGIAFTVRDETGMKIAYYGLRKNGEEWKEIPNRHFNPEGTLYNFHSVNKDEPLILTRDIWTCLHYIDEGNQAVCNFNLPYFSPRQVELLNTLNCIIRVNAEFPNFRDTASYLGKNLKLPHWFT